VTTGPTDRGYTRDIYIPYGSAGPLKGLKGYTDEGGSRVPGIIRWPGKVKAGSVSQEPISGVDILPSLCAIASAEVPTDRPIDGVNILPIFEGRSLTRKIPLYFREDGGQNLPFTIAMRDGDWKLLVDPKLTKFELYNLRRDIGEKHNVTESEPERLEALKKELLKLHAEIEAECPKWNR